MVFSKQLGFYQAKNLDFSNKHEDLPIKVLIFQRLRATKMVTGCEDFEHGGSNRVAKRLAWLLSAMGI